VLRIELARPAERIVSLERASVLLDVAGSNAFAIEPHVAVHRRPKEHREAKSEQAECGPLAEFAKKEALGSTSQRNTFIEAFYALSSVSSRFPRLTTSSTAYPSLS
jgi:hypothetical protein